MRSFVGLRRGGGGEMPGDDKEKITIMIMKETGFSLLRVSPWATIIPPFPNNSRTWLWKVKLTAVSPDSVFTA